MHNSKSDKLLFSLWLMSAELVTYVEKSIKPLGLTVHDLRAVIILGESGPMSPSDLADILDVTNGAVTGIVDRLLAAKVATRDQVGADKRRRRISVQYSDLDNVLMDAVTAMRIVFDNYSAADVTVIEGHYQDVYRVLTESKRKARGTKSARD